MRHTCWLVLFILTLGAHRAAAQSAPPAGGPGPLRQDTIAVFLGFSVPEGFGLAKSVVAEYLLNAQSIAATFEPPRPWQLPVSPGTHFTTQQDRVFREGICICLGLEGFLVFRLSADGHLLTADFTAEPGAPGLGAALVAAVRRADSLGLLVAPATKPEQRRDTTMILQIGSARARSPGFIPFSHIRLISQPADRGPRVVSLPASILPDTAQGTVILQYDIGTDGRADTQSMLIVFSDDSVFSREAVSVIARAQFTPAMAGAVPVRSRVMQRLSFGESTRIIKIPFATVRP